MKNQEANTKITLVRIQDGEEIKTVFCDQVIPYRFLDQELAIEKVEAMAYSLIDSQASFFGNPITEYRVEAEIECWAFGTEEFSELNFTLQHSENGLKSEICKASGILA